MICTQNLRSLREELKMTQEIFAKKIGLKHKAKVCDYENGRRKLNIKTAKKIIALAALYNITINLDYIFPS